MMGNAQRIKVIIEGIFEMMQEIPTNDINVFWQIVCNHIAEDNTITRLHDFYDISLFEDEPLNTFQCQARINQLEKVLELIWKTIDFIDPLLPEFDCEEAKYHFEEGKNAYNAILSIVKDGSQEFTLFSMLILLRTKINCEITTLKDMLPTEPEPEPKPEPGKARVTDWLIQLAGSEKKAKEIVIELNTAIPYTRQKTKTIINIFSKIPKFRKEFYYPAELANALTECTGETITRQNLQPYKDQFKK